MWKTAETKAEKIRVAKTKGRGEERERRKEIRSKEVKEEGRKEEE